MGDWIGFENWQIYRRKFKIAAVAVETMIKNKALLVISSKFDHAKFIGHHYFFMEKQRKSVLGSVCLHLGVVMCVYLLSLRCFNVCLPGFIEVL